MKALELYGLLLFSGRRFSLIELADRLDCSKQTVLRRVEEIELHHRLPFQIGSEKIKGQNYYWAERPSRLPNVSLDVESIQNLSL